MAEMTPYQEDIRRLYAQGLTFDALQGRTLLVAGATGLVGACVVDIVMADPHRNLRVFAAGRNRRRAEERFAAYAGDPRFSFVEMDVTRPVTGETPYDYIIDAASNASPNFFKQQPVEVIKANIDGVANLLDYGRQHGLRKMVYVSSGEMQALSQFPADQLNPLLANLSEMRRAMFTSDAMRSFIIILIGTVCLVLFMARKLKAVTLAGLLLALCLIDLWMVNKRYLNDAMFVPKYEREQAQPKTETDEIILADKSLDYRVLNLASNTFNENETSYYHKSIGGYHAAKLRRYQELIEAYISPEMQQTFAAVAEAAGDMTLVKGDSVYPVLNMLNTKYFILPLQGGQTVPLENPYTYGNAWFVDKLDYVDNANQELDMTGQLPLRHEAVADKKFRDVLGDAIQQDSLSMVTIKAYEPNQLTYEVQSGKGGIIVFSEIYYPGWTATVDGVEKPVGRVNYVLRALRVEPGKHEVVLSFFPKSIDRTETVAYVGYALLLVVLLLLVWRVVRKNRKDEKDTVAAA